MAMNTLIRCMLLFGILLMFSCNSEETDTAHEATSAPVRVMEVSSRQRQEKYNLVGIIETDREIKLGFKLGGKITHLHFEEGQRIQAGTRLAELDTTEWLAQKEKALENQSKSKRDLERMEKLFSQKIVPESSLQDARSTCKLAGAELKIVEDALVNSSIKAPFSGRIIKKLAEEGEIVGPGTPIALLAKMDPILVKAAIPDHLIPKIHVGDHAVIKVDWDPSNSFSGTVRRMEPVADPVTRTIRAEILVANPKEILKPGLMARVEIVHREAEPCIYLPLDAVLGLGVNPHIFIIKDQKAERRQIKTGRVMEDQIEITEGLACGEAVVISGQSYLRDGQGVHILYKIESGQ